VVGFLRTLGCYVDFLVDCPEKEGRIAHGPHNITLLLSVLHSACFCV
jgi:hypothetical protein